MHGLRCIKYEWLLFMQIKQLIVEGGDKEVRQPEHLEQIRVLQQDLGEARSTIRLFVDQNNVLQKQAETAQAQAKQLQEEAGPLQKQVR